MKIPILSPLSLHHSLKALKLLYVISLRVSASKPQCPPERGVSRMARRAMSSAKPCLLEKVGKFSVFHDKRSSKCVFDDSLTIVDVSSTFKIRINQIKKQQDKVDGRRRNVDYIGVISTAIGVLVKYSSVCKSSKYFQRSTIY